MPFPGYSDLCLAIQSLSTSSSQASCPWCCRFSRFSPRDGWAAGRRFGIPTNFDATPQIRARCAKRKHHAIDSAARSLGALGGIYATLDRLEEKRYVSPRLGDPIVCRLVHDANCSDVGDRERRIFLSPNRSPILSDVVRSPVGDCRNAVVQAAAEARCRARIGHIERH